MSITIQIPPDLEERLRASAAEAGMDIDEYVIEILKGKVKPGPSKELAPEEKERSLLQKINLAYRWLPGKGTITLNLCGTRSSWALKSKRS